jgi:hypothetical protein
MKLKKMVGKETFDPTRLMLAYLCVATEGREASIPAKVKILDRFDLSDSEIARVCGTNPQVVRNARQAAKHKH